MNSIRLIAIMSLLSLASTANAACPKAISGTYSGYLVETRSDGSTTLILATTVVTTQGTGTTTLLGGARSGPNGSATTTSTFSFTTTATFSSSTCSGITTVTSGPETGAKSLYTISNNGNSLNSVGGLRESDGSGVSVSLGVFTKQ